MGTYDRLGKNTMDSIQDIVEYLERDWDAARAELKSSRDYAYAYGRLEGILNNAIVYLRQSDPLFGLQIMSYDEIVNREA
jgi:hypothetical protein